jgi:hypothetical protein
MVRKRKRPSDLRFSNTLRLIGDPFSCHALLLLREVDVQPSCSCEKEEAGRDIEGLLMPKSAFALLQT